MMRRTPKHQRARAGAPAKLAGVDQAAWARSTGAELDGDGGDWRRRWRNPTVTRKRATRRSRGAIGRRRISPELAGVGRGARRRLKSPEGELGLGFDREGSEWGGTASWAEPVRSSPLRVTDVRWAQAVSPVFDFDLVWFDSKTLKGKP
jgi:hypothetical protein